MKKIFLLTILSFLFAGAYSANAAVYFVNGTTGSDTYDGLLPTHTGGHGPKKTMQAAFDIASPEEDIYVSNALYTENLTVSKAMYLHLSSNVRLNGLTMSGTDIHLYLDGYLNIQDVITFDKGYIVTDSNSLLVANYTTVQAGGSKYSFVYGPMGVKVASASPHRIVKFSIGKDTTYRPAVIDMTPSNATSSIFIGEVFNATPPDKCIPDGVNNISTVRYWCFSTTCTGIRAAKITLGYGEDDGVIADETTIVKEDDDTAACWMNLCGLASSTEPYGTIMSCCRFFTLGCFTLGNVDQSTDPLPVQMLSFNAKQLKTDLVELKWATASEINNNYFTIERSTDFQKWVPVCRVEGHGTTNLMNNYSCFDSTVKYAGQNTVFYRSKQVDYNGSAEFHKIIKLRLVQTTELAAGIGGVYPNPAIDRINITYNAKENSPILIRILNLEGKTMASSSIVAIPGQQNLDVSLAEASLPKGMYLIEIQSGKEVYRQKMMKE